MNPSTVPPAEPDPELLRSLCGQFYSSASEAGQFTPVEAGEMPEPYRSLLAHNHHMTVTVERYHHGPVDVQVLEKRSDTDHYARKILLTRQSDGVVVQFGIMRVRLDQIAPSIVQEILGESVPLGRVLISHDVLREVEVVALYRVTPSEPLRDLLGLEPNVDTYGRTARLHVEGAPAVELLEVVTP